MTWVGSEATLHPTFSHLMPRSYGSGRVGVNILGPEIAGEIGWIGWFTRAHDRRFSACRASAYRRAGRARAGWERRQPRSWRAPRRAPIASGVPRLGRLKPALYQALESIASWLPGRPTCLPRHAASPSLGGPYVLADPGHDVVERRARLEDLPHAGLVQRAEILVGHDAAAEDGDVATAARP